MDHRGQPRVAGVGIACVAGPDLASFADALRSDTPGRVAQWLGWPAARLAHDLQRDPLHLCRTVTQEALADARLSRSILADPGTILVVSTTKGDIGGILGGPGEISLGPFLGRVRETLGHRGHAELVSTACASGDTALTRAVRLLQAGWGRRAIVLGVDLLHDFLFHGFAALEALSHEPCQPYDGAFRGMSLGEAVAAVVLVQDHREGIRLSGTGLACDAHTLLRPPRDGRGLALAIHRALRAAGRDSVHGVCGHGVALEATDLMEGEALRRSLGAPIPPLFGIKGAVGHTLGCAAVLDAVACTVALRERFLPGTVGCAAPGIGREVRVNRRARGAEIDSLLSVSAGFGGVDAALMFERGEAHGEHGPSETRRVFLHGVAFVDGSHMGGPRCEGGRRRWCEIPGTQRPPAHLFFDDRKSLGRLDLPGRYVLGAASLLPRLAPGLTRRTGVVLGSESGCLDTDLKFVDSLRREPRGRLYARALPSVPAAEVAMQFGFQGACFALIQQGAAGLLAMVAAAHEIQHGDALAMVAGGYEAVEEPSSLAAGPWAVLALLSATPPDDGNGYEVLLEPGGSARGEPADMHRLYEIVQHEAPPSFELSCAAGGQPIRLCFHRA